MEIAINLLEALQNMKDFEHCLDKYADLVIQVGINLQKGQDFIINAPLESAELVRKITAKAYEAGAKLVHVFWDDEELTKIRLLHADSQTLSDYPAWRAKTFEELASNGAAYLMIKVPDPDLLSGIDSERFAKMNRASSIAMQNFSAYTRNHKISWCLIKAPTRAWAKKVLPNLAEEEQIAKLWDLIFTVMRIYDADPVQAWREHLQNLESRQTLLNEKRYRKLHYRSAGTDLTVELPERHLWVSGATKNDAGIDFVANMPTEEVFTLPLREGVNGFVRSTKPLNYGGNLIDGFTLTFEKGRITHFTAETGYEALKRLVETDNGSMYLGEVALVPHDSPISNLNTIFYNTGLDENAACHFAIGNAYPTCLEGGSQLTKEELMAQGVNVSLTHVDFMMGSESLDIDGELTDGSLEPIFRKGNWVI